MSLKDKVGELLPPNSKDWYLTVYWSSRHYWHGCSCIIDTDSAYRTADVLYSMLEYADFYCVRLWKDGPAATEVFTFDGPYKVDEEAMNAHGDELERREIVMRALDRGIPF